MFQGAKLMLALQRNGQTAALLGGSALIAHYGLHLIYGLQTGRILWEAMNTPLGKLDGIVFAGAFAAIDVAILSVCTRTDKRAPGISRTGAVFATYALLVMLIGKIGLLAGKMLPFAFSTGCLTMFVSALLAGVAALRTQTLPTRAGWPMMLFALLTAPTAMLLPNLRGPLPEYAVEELHFVFAGLAWIAISSLLATRCKMRAVVSAPVPA